MATAELIELHDVATGKKTTLLSEQRPYIRNLVFTGNSKQLAAVDASRVVMFYQMASGGLAARAGSRPISRRAAIRGRRSHRRSALL